MRILFLALLAALPLPAFASPGALDTQGCHADPATGAYHCHPERQEAQPLGLFGGGGAYENCDAARAAGVAPVREGEMGFGPHLDRDRDGVGCE